MSGIDRGNNLYIFVSSRTSQGHRLGRSKTPNAILQKRIQLKLQKMQIMHKMQMAKPKAQAKAKVVHDARNLIVPAWTQKQPD